MKDAGSTIDFNKVKSKVFNDPTQTSKGTAIIGKKYLIVDHNWKPLNADANLISKMNKRDPD